MKQDEASAVARTILRDLVRREQESGSFGFLSYKLLRRLVVHAKLVGIAVEQHVLGPWHVDQAQQPGRWSRLGAVWVPIVKCGSFILPVANADEAIELAGFLNWCMVPEPVVG